jgi:hypothetical protein
MPLLEFSRIENKKGTFIRIFWIIIRKVSTTRFISNLLNILIKGRKEVKCIDEAIHFLNGI